MAALGACTTCRQVVRNRTGRSSSAKVGGQVLLAAEEPVVLGEGDPAGRQGQVDPGVLHQELVTELVPCLRK